MMLGLSSARNRVANENMEPNIIGSSYRTNFMKNINNVMPNCQSSASLNEANVGISRVMHSQRSNPYYVGKQQQLASNNEPHDFDSLNDEN